MYIVLASLLLFRVKLTKQQGCLLTFFPMVLTILFYCFHEYWADFCFFSPSINNTDDVLWRTIKNGCQSIPVCIFYYQDVFT